MNFGVEIEGEFARVVNLVLVVCLYIELSISFYRVFHAFVATGFDFSYVSLLYLVLLLRLNDNNFKNRA